MTEPRLLITLFTDAGYCPRTHLASFAAWAKADGQTMRQSGVLKGHLTSNNLAELRALVNGVALVLAAFRPAPGSRIIAQTDSLQAIMALSPAGPRRQRTRKRLAPEIGAMRALVERFGIEIEYRHVPSHQGNSSPRTAVNTWCDRECRQQLKAARATAMPAPIAAPPDAGEGAHA